MMDPEVRRALLELSNRVAALEARLREAGSAAPPAPTAAAAPAVDVTSTSAVPALIAGLGTQSESPLAPPPVPPDVAAAMPPPAPPVAPDDDRTGRRAAAFHRLYAAAEESADESAEESADESAAAEPGAAARAAADSDEPIAGLELLPAGAPGVSDVAGPEPEASPAARRGARTNFEVWFAERWLAWVGGLVLVLAAGAFVRLAYEEGWIGRLPPLVKCLLAAGFGATLLVAGEWCLRQAGRLAAVGLFGAGLGTLYVTAFATFRYYALVSESGAFVLLALVAALGFGITVRGQLASIGVLSLIGGYLAPILLQGASTFPAALPLYLTFLLAIGLGLSGWRIPAFGPIRTTVLILHGLLAWAWVFDQRHAPPALPLTFVSLWWALATAALIWTARRSAAAVFAPAVWSLLVTAWLTLFSVWILGAERLSAASTLCAVFAALAAALAVVFGGRPALAPRPATALARLGLSLFAQAGVLLAVAVALRFDGYGRSIGWLAIALAAVELGRRLPSRWVDAYGALVAGLAFFRVAFVDREASALSGVLLTSDVLRVTHWSILALLAIAACHVIARRIRHPGEPAWPDAPALFSGLSVLGWLALSGHQFGPAWVTGAWLLAAAALIGAAPVGRVQRYLPTAAAVLTAGALRWVFSDVVSRRMAAGWSATAEWPFLNLQTAWAVAILGLAFWLAHALRRRPAQEVGTGLATRVGALVALLGGTALLLVAFSFEIDRAVGRFAADGPTAWSAWHVRQLLWTLLWSLGALAIAGLARLWFTNAAAAWERRVVRLVAGFVLAVCAGKWLLADTLLARGQLLSSALTQSAPLANLQMLTGFALAAGLVLLTRRARNAELDAAEARADALQRWAPVLAALLLVWGLTFEIDRALLKAAAAGYAAPWPELTHRWLWWLLLWIGAAVALRAFGRWRDWAEFNAAGAVVHGLAFAGWLTLGTLLPRVVEGVTCLTPVANLQFGVGVALLVSAWFTLRWGPTGIAALDQHLRAVMLGLVVTAGLWLGSFELDRLLAPEAGRLSTAAMARHTALSVYWGLYAIGLLAVGFRARWPAARYVGLALLGITLGKVMLVDMASVRYAYRVLSLLAIGLLLVGTSVAYARRARSLEADAGADAGADTDADAERH